MNKKNYITPVIFLSTINIIFIIIIFKILHDDYTKIIILCFLEMIISSFIMINIIINKRIEFLYKNISLIDNDIFSLKNRSTDLKTLIDNLEKFTNSKKEEMIILSDRDKFRREFIGNLSHEIKTPIFIIQGYIFSISNELKNENYDINLINNFIERTEKSLDSISNIINNMETISNIETGIYNINISNFNIINVINNCIYELEDLSKKNGIKIIYDRFYNNEIIVTADKDKIKQVIYNVLSNAIFYGKKNVIISIKHLDDNYKISIKDDGIGMDDISKKRIFERFYRADQSRNKNTGGSGLGMSIVKHIMDIHNQKIEIISQLNQGTEVSFFIKKT